MAVYPGIRCLIDPKKTLNYQRNCLADIRQTMESKFIF